MAKEDGAGDTGGMDMGLDSLMEETGDALEAAGEELKEAAH